MRVKCGLPGLTFEWPPHSHTVSKPLADFSSSKTFLSGSWVILNPWHPGPLECAWKCTMGCPPCHNEWRGGPTYADLTHAQQPPVTIPQLPRERTALHNMLSFQFTLSLIFTEISLRPHYVHSLMTPTLCPRTTPIYPSQSTRHHTTLESSVYLCIPQRCTPTTRVAPLTARVLPYSFSYSQRLTVSHRRYPTHSSGTACMGRAERKGSGARTWWDSTSKGMLLKRKQETWKDSVKRGLGGSLAIGPGLGHTSSIRRGPKGGGNLCEKTGFSREKFRQTQIHIILGQNSPEERGDLSKGSQRKGMEIPGYLECQENVMKYGL